MAHWKHATASGWRQGTDAEAGIAAAARYWGWSPGVLEVFAVVAWEAWALRWAQDGTIALCCGVGRRDDLGGVLRRRILRTGLVKLVPVCIFGIPLVSLLVEIDDFQKCFGVLLLLLLSDAGASKHVLPFPG